MKNGPQRSRWIQNKSWDEIMRRVSGYNGNTVKGKKTCWINCLTACVLATIFYWGKNWVWHVDSIERPIGTGNKGLSLKRLCDSWGRNELTNCPNLWESDNDDGNDYWGWWKKLKFCCRMDSVGSVQNSCLDYGINKASLVSNNVIQVREYL